MQLVGIGKPIVQRNGLYTISPECVIDDISKTDLIIIPAMHGDMPQAIKDNATFIPWIKHQHRQGAEIASLCIAAFFLAETGLIGARPIYLGSCTHKYIW